MSEIKLQKSLASIPIERRILWGILFCFLIVYIIQFSNHLFELLHILNTCQREILELNNTKEVGMTFLLASLVGLALLCYSYQKEINMTKNKFKISSSISKFQERRIDFVNELLKQLTKTDKINEYFYKEDFLKETNFDDEEFNTYKWASGYNFCATNGDSSGKERYKINTEQCIKAYDQNEQSELLKLSSRSESKILKLTIVMAFIALVQAALAFLQLYGKQ